MPATKLTLRLDARTIEQAKRYARSRGTSVSRLVERYFAALDTPADVGELPPITAWFADRPAAAPVEPDAYDRYREAKYG